MKKCKFRAQAALDLRRFPEEIARAGGLAAWNATNDRDVERWTFRTRLAGDIVAAAVRAAAR